MATPDQIYAATVLMCTKNIPGFRVRFKDESLKMKAIGLLVWPFNRRFMSGFTTTVYPNVYFPSREWVSKNKTTAAKVLLHEYVHLWDEKSMGGLRYKLSYMTPQALAAVGLWGLLGLKWGVMYWMFLLLAMLLPLPSRGRMKIERRGYAMSMAINGWRYGNIHNDTLRWIARQFTGFSYYLMWPFKKSVVRFLEEDRRRILDSRILQGGDGEPYRDAIELLSQLGELK